MNRIDRLLLFRLAGRIGITVLVFFGLIALVESLDAWRFSHLMEAGGLPLAIFVNAVSAIRWTIKTLPVTVLSLGLFLFVINALVFWTAAAALEGFGVRDLVAALVGSLLYTAMGIVIESALERLFAKR